MLHKLDLIDLVVYHFNWSEWWRTIYGWRVRSDGECLLVSPVCRQHYIISPNKIYYKGKHYEGKLPFNDDGNGHFSSNMMKGSTFMSSHPLSHCSITVSTSSSSFHAALHFLMLPLAPVHELMWLIIFPIHTFQPYFGRSVK